MRSILALLILLAAVPCYAVSQTFYVNPSAASARNLPGYGLSPTDSPWISPSYAITQIDGDNDTLYIYAAGTDSNFYDYVNIGTKWVNVHGVSVNGDSPTLEKNGIYYEAYASTCTKTISGLYFYNITLPKKGIEIYDATLTNTPVWYFVSDCIFDSITGNVAVFGYSPAIHYATLKNANQTQELYINNCSFGRGGVNTSAISCEMGYTSQAYCHMRVSNCSVRTPIYAALRLYGTSVDTFCYTVDSIINSETMVVPFNQASAGKTAGFDMRYTDTFGNVVTQSKLTLNNDVTLTYYNANNYNVNPLFSVARTDPAAAYCYLNTASPVTDSSSTGGLIGVLWGHPSGSPTPEQAASMRRAPLAYRYQWLLRRW